MIPRFDKILPKRKHLISLILITIVVCGAVATYGTIAQLSGNTIYFEDYPATATYVIKTDGINVWEVRYDGKVVLNSTNAHEVIQNATDSLGTLGGLIFIRRGVYEIDNPVVFDNKSNVQLVAEEGTTLKLKDNYLGYYHHGYSGIAIANSNNIILSGITLDGNRANVSQQNELIDIWASESILIEKSTLKNANYHAMVIGYTNGNVNSLLIDRCNFVDNCDETGSDSDVYTWGGGAQSAVFQNCYFTRSDFSITKQAFYMNNGTYSYINNCFKNIHIPFDFRDGSHFVQSAWGDTVSLVIITQVGTPQVWANGLNFTNICGIGGYHPAGIAIHGGTMHLENAYLKAKLPIVNASFGLWLQGPMTRRCLIRNCRLDDFSSYGIIVGGSGGGHVLENNFIRNTLVGIGSRYNNTAISIARDNSFENVANYKYYIDDGQLLIKGNVGFVAENSGTATLPSGASSVSFIHGLSGQPQIVTYSWGTDIGKNRSSYWTANSTHITVHISQAASANYQLSWYAEYKP